MADSTIAYAEAISDALGADSDSSQSAKSLAVTRRIALCQECIDCVVASAEEWVRESVRAKGLPSDSPLAAEDMLSGPVVVVRILQLTIQSLKAIAAGQTPRLPGRISRLESGQLSVPVFPTHGMFDSLAFMGLRASVRMQHGVDESRIHGDLVDQIRSEKIFGVTAVLGAGNVSSIPATDSLHKIMFEGRRVFLKMNPVNEYLAPVFENAFAPLIREGLLVLATGGIDFGSAAIHHELVDEVHLTGSTATHDAIVWGEDEPQREIRKQNNSPILTKPVTSELGNITPWIVVPGNYSSRELRSQAQHLAASITNNASFNCLATKVIITGTQWNQRQQFLQLVQHYLDQTPRRPAYYPGAVERFETFAGRKAPLDSNDCLPWTLLTDQSIDERPELFTEESFVCVCAETGLEAESPENFLASAVEFVNERMPGSLCASLTVSGSFRRTHKGAVETAIRDLRYGSVCLNQWSGLAYGLASPPWGAYPGNTLKNPDSGIGSVHNTYLLDGFEKTFLEGPLVNFPKPLWFSSHRTALVAAQQLLQLYRQPSCWKLPRLFLAALRG